MHILQIITLLSLILILITLIIAVVVAIGNITVIWIGDISSHIVIVIKLNHILLQDTGINITQHNIMHVVILELNLHVGGV